MSLNRSLTLRIKVDGAEKLDDLKTLAKEFAAVGPQLRASLSGAASDLRQVVASLEGLKAAGAKATATTEAGAKKATAEVAKLKNQVAELTAQVKSLQLQSAEGPIKESAIQKSKSRVAELRAELNKLYLQQLGEGKRAVVPVGQSRIAWLREMRAAGVQLAPDDKAALDRANWQIRATERSTREVFKAQKEREANDRKHAATLAAEEAKRNATLAKLAEERKKIYANMEAEVNRLQERARAEREKHYAAVRRANARFMSQETSDVERLATAQRARAAIGSGQSISEVHSQFGTAATRAAVSESRMSVLSGAAVAETELKRTTKAAERELTKQRRELQDTSKAYDGFHATVRGAAGGIGAIWLSWGRPLTALWAGFASVSLIREGIQNLAEFEHQLRVIQGVTGDSTQAINKMGEAALRMAKDGIYSATEIASSLRVLAQAGLSSTGALAAQPTVSDFATVGETDLASSSEALLGITTAFGKPLQSIDRVAEVIGRAAAVSQTTIESMTQAIAQASVVAGQYRGNLEEVAAALAVLATRNIKGTAAGTALKNGIRELYAPTDQAAQAMALLGLKSYDAEGNMRDFVDVMGDMRNLMSQYDEKSQNRFFSVVFGERGAKVGSALLGSFEQFKQAIETFKNSGGFMAEASYLIEQSLPNRWKNLVNNLSSSLQEAFDKVAPELREIMDGLLKTIRSDEFQRVIGLLAVSFARLTKSLVDNVGLLAVVFSGFFGASMLRMFSPLMAVLSDLPGKAAAAVTATRAAATAGVAATAATSVSQVAMMPLGASRMADAAGKATNSLALWGGKILAVGGFLLRFAGWVGVVVLAIQGLKALWDWLANETSNPTASEQMSKDVDAILARRKAELEARYKELKEAQNPVSIFNPTDTSLVYQEENALKSTLAGAQGPEVTRQANALRSRIADLRAELEGSANKPQYKRNMLITEIDTLSKHLEHVVGPAEKAKKALEEFNAKIRENSELSDKVNALRQTPEQISQEANRLGTGPLQSNFRVETDAQFAALITGQRRYAGSSTEAMANETAKEQARISALRAAGVTTELSTAVAAARAESAELRNEVTVQENLLSELTRLYDARLAFLSQEHVNVNGVMDDRIKTLANERSEVLQQAKLRVDSAHTKVMIQQITARSQIHAATIREREIELAKDALIAKRELQVMQNTTKYIQEEYSHRQAVLKLLNSAGKVSDLDAESRGRDLEEAKASSAVSRQRELIEKIQATQAKARSDLSTKFADSPALLVEKLRDFDNASKAELDSVNDALNELQRALERIRDINALEAEVSAEARRRDDKEFYRGLGAQFEASRYELTAPMRELYNSLEDPFSLALSEKMRGISSRYQPMIDDLWAQIDDPRNAGKGYEDRLAKVYELMDAERKLASGEHMKEVAAAQDPWLGAKLGVADYAATLTNVAEQTRSAMTNSLQAVEDAFVDMAVNGKLNFKQLADSIIAELARIAFRQTIMKAIIGLFPSGSYGITGGAQEPVSTLHSGGLVGAASRTKNVNPLVFLGASRYHTGGLVGDEVPIIAKRGERVLTAAQNRAYERGSNSSPEVALHVTNNGTPSEVKSTETAFDGKRLVVNVVMDDIRRNGPISRAMGARR